MKDKKFIKVDIQEYTLYTLLSDCTWSIFDDVELKPHLDAVLSILEKRLSFGVDTKFELSNVYVVEEYEKI